MLAELAHAATFRHRLVWVATPNPVNFMLHQVSGSNWSLLSITQSVGSFIPYSGLKHSRRLSILMDHAIHTQHFTSS